ncbi:ester cyclase [Streptomyces acidicola]|uniref:ester cyclase n=1 Tax=Streptomyces acidicola TaxID=2596892 RepID=UPI00342658A8
MPNSAPSGADSGTTSVTGAGRQTPPYYRALKPLPLTAYFDSVREAFDDRAIRRGIVVAEGDHLACQTWIEGTFAREFTQSPAGPLPPNGKRIVFDLINIFRFDDQGRLIEEWVHTDNRSLLRQLGPEGG